MLIISFQGFVVILVEQIALIATMVLVAMTFVTFCI